jgi:hypothetical protein
VYQGPVTGSEIELRNEQYFRPLKQPAKFIFIGISSISRPFKCTVKFIYEKGTGGKFLRCNMQIKADNC